MSACGVSPLAIPLLAAAAASGCGTVIEYREEAELLASGDLTAISAGPNDCDVEAGYVLDSYMAEKIAAPELHIVGIYGARRQPGVPFGEATIRVERAGPSVLVLSAYERTRWTLHAGPGAGVERVIVTGYGAQEVAGPAGVPVEIVDFATSGDVLGIAVMWPSEADRAGDCTDFFGPTECELYGSSWRHELERRIQEVDRLVERAQDRTGLTLSTFHGCHQMSRFALVETTRRREVGGLPANRLAGH